MQFSHHTGPSFPDESTAFVALAWQELFDPTTPDSYRPRLFDTHGLVGELSSLAELASQDARWSRHIDLVQRELRWAASAESCWLRDSPWSAEIIEKISGTTETAQIVDLAELFASTSPDPVAGLCECLHRETLSLPKNKEKTLAVLRLLGTQAIRRELTGSDVALDLSDVQPGDRLAVVSRLRGLFQAEKRSFHCVVHLLGKTSHIHSLFSHHGFRQARTKDFPLNVDGQSFKNLVDRESAFRYETKATSHLAAAANAVRECRRVIDVFNLYQNRASIELDASILVVDDRRTTIVSRHTEQSLATKPSRAAPTLTREVLRDVSFDKLDLGLENALEQHSLALSTTEPKASLVGIWTAFECLVGSDRRDANVSRVVDWLAPIIALRRVEKITRYLAVRCHGYLKAASRGPSEAFSRSTSFYFSPRDVLDAITGPEDNRLILQLLRDVADSPLLRFQVHNAWRRTHDHKFVRRDLQMSQRKLSWHLERIYRARNLTVHRGKTPPFVSELVDRAQHYFTRCVSRVLADLREYPTWTVSTSLEQQRQRFHFVVERLKTAPQDVPASYLFPRDDEFRACYPWKSTA